MIILKNIKHNKSGKPVEGEDRGIQHRLKLKKNGISDQPTLPIISSSLEVLKLTPENKSNNTVSLTF